MQKSKPDKPLDKKQIFLLLFARELIRNSEEGLLQLKRILEHEGAPLSEISRQALKIVNKEEFPLIKSILSEMPRLTFDGEFSAIKPVNITSQRMEISNGYGRQQYPVLKIPEPKLPEEFRYLKPVASAKREIDLDKLNQLVGDPGVKKIECDGPNKPVIVSGIMGRKPTEVILSNNEIEDIVERFSRAARIPADVGLFRVVVGNLIFSAIISDVVPSRFIITKMASSNQINFRPLPPPVPPAVKMSYSDYIRPI